MEDFVRVFPSSSSNAIRNSVAVLHYSPPPVDPPIDYTLKIKPNSNATSYGNISTISWGPDQNSTNVQSQHNYWPKQRQTTAGINHYGRYPSENRPAGVGKFRRDTVEESASVLEDLDHLLDNEELTLQQRMSRLEIRHGRSLPNLIPNAAVVKQREARRSPEQIPVTSNFRLRRESSARSTSPITVQLRRNVPTSPDRRSQSYVADGNERRKLMVEEKYRETERKVDEAVRLYTPEYFKRRMNSSPTLPLWKSELMARKLSNETIEKIQEEAWREFAEWKRLHAPSVTIQPAWRNKRQPLLL